ncbi:MAG TPA: bile acid:sodium symporter family protein [Chromatiales bacterium]|nr:bile acid:sodium symporter family protein [Chromatiaceae bacterium]HIN82138.1 bile acid:sodium symporter family protein [Chromatiales bacterium]HIO14376.1 bile acid:sodium symporter family protein [Chromatiales bacterium]HIO53862.1 bile acid:sodium symporter family protein [Chromatiales bacterium]
MVLRLLANGLAPLTLIGALLAYWHPPLFLVFKSSFLYFFAATMFALGLVLEPPELSDTLKHPSQIGLGVLTQYSVMPVLSFACAWYSDLSPELALGIIIVGCAPGAMASNVIVYLAGGAVAYSIALTTVATLLSPLLTPTLVEWLGGAFLPIPFWPMMQTILWMVLAPLLAGMLLHRILGARIALARDIAPAVASVAIVIICSYAVAANHERIGSVGPSLFALVVSINACGYLLGWFLARLYGFDRRHRLTLSIEIGMQNAGLGVALALEHFGPETALPGALFAVWCILTAAGASGWLRRREARRASRLALEN